ncbi:MAG TPA: redoxin domain-containing protein [Candidatus Angelobacter sp.]|nr:redoxin domain-containing protein [Candidatus Angelobacter sp.]
MMIPTGRVLRHVAAASSNGELKTISMPAAPSEKLLIMAFSPTCESCQASQPAWKSLAKELRARLGWRVLWISRDPIQNTIAYCREQQIPLEDTVADPTYRTYMQLALKVVPSTVVVGDGGRVEKVWSGRVDEKQWGEISSYFNLRQKELPALALDKDSGAVAAK